MQAAAKNRHFEVKYCEAKILLDFLNFFGGFMT
jgi:hypothetical protein